MKLRVRHYPQIPCEPFVTEVKDLEQAKLLSDILGHYDLFQFDNGIKPDYCNMTLIEQWDEEEQQWMGWWFDEETGIDDINEYFEHLKNV
jgi:hypothetical protein